ncbi:MAG: hypothetical protein H8F28_11410 [Fibrella sp.]|nr:hypothetical protein [Armatimonadota bacterium]
MHLRFHHLTLATAVTVATILTTFSPAQAVVRFGSPNQKYMASTGEYASIPFGRIAIDGATVDGNGIPRGGNPAWPISPNWALRANHAAAGRTGFDIVQNGVAHRVVESVNVAGTDLLLVRVEDPFSSFFNMYRGSDEIGKEMVVFGSSDPSKTTEVRTGTPSLFNGWNLGATTEVPLQPGEVRNINWGRNTVTSFEMVGNTNTLYSTFDAPTLPGGALNPASVGDDEAIVYTGDSGGGVFIEEAGEWRLAGIVFAVDAAYPTQASNQLLLGAIFDARNLWTDEPVDPAFPNGPKKRVQITGDNPIPYGSYSSRISQYRSNIDTITKQTAGLGPIAVPESGTGQLALLGMGCGVFGLLAARRRQAT